MDNVVAVVVHLDTEERRYFLTWGRVIDEPDLLLQVVLEHSASCDLGGKPVRAELCASVREAANEPYFYECFFDMCQTKIPYGKRYDKWLQQMQDELKQSKEISYLGHPW
jgi:hypothetical protein